MGLARLGPKKLRRIQRAVGDDITVLRAVVASHAPEYWVWHFVTADHRHGAFDSRTGEWAFHDVRTEWCTCSCEEFPDYEQRIESQRLRNQMEWLKLRVDLAAQVREAAAQMRRHLRLPDDEVITVVPPAELVDTARRSLAADTTLVVSDEKARR